MADAVAFDGGSRWDDSIPGVTARKPHEVSELCETGWMATPGLRGGIADCAVCYLTRVGNFREAG